MSPGDDGQVRVFPFVTRFQEMARRPGGIPRDKALEAAQANIDEIKPGFDDWLNEQMNGLVALVDQAKAGKAPEDWLEKTNALSRQLRDVGTTMDFELLTYIADSLCEILDAIVAGAECNLDSITCHIDAMLLARQKGYRGVKPEQVPELTEGLRRIADQVSVSPT